MNPPQTRIHVFSTEQKALLEDARIFVQQID